MDASLNQSKCNDSTGCKYTEFQSDPSKTYCLLPKSKADEDQKVVQLLSADHNDRCRIRIQFDNYSSDSLTSSVNSSSELNRSSGSFSTKTKSTAESYYTMSPSADHPSSKIEQSDSKQRSLKVRLAEESPDQIFSKRLKGLKQQQIIKTKSINDSMNEDVWAKIAKGLDDSTFWDSPVKHQVERGVAGLANIGPANYGPIPKPSPTRSKSKRTPAIAKSKSTGNIISSSIMQRSAHRKLNTSFETPSAAGLDRFCNVLKSSSDPNSTEQPAPLQFPPMLNHSDKSAEKSFKCRTETEHQINNILDAETSLDNETKQRIFDKMNSLIKSTLAKAMNQLVDQMVTAKNDFLNSSTSEEELNGPTENKPSTRPNPTNGEAPVSSSQKENSLKSPIVQVQVRKRKSMLSDQSKVRTRSPTEPRMRPIPCYEIERLRNGNSVVRDSRTQRLIKVISVDDPQK